jgi:hypothetical protein
MVPLTNPDGRLWRTDMRMGRNIYMLLSNDVNKPSEFDPLVGIMETSELAESVTDLHNNALTKFGRHFVKALSTND